MLKIFIATISFSFVIGCLIAYYIAPPPLLLPTVIVILGTVVVICRRNSKIVLICVCIIAILLGMSRVILTNRNTENTLVRDHPDQVSIEGVIVSDIEEKSAHNRYTVEILRINGVKPEKKSSVLVYEPYPTECLTGEKVAFSGRLNRPENFLSSSERVFQYEKYLRQFSIYAITTVQESPCTGKKQRYTPFAKLRKRLVTAMSTFLPTQEASLLSGLVLGLRGSLSPELLDAFRVTGLIHIIVLSGYNVTLIAETIRRLFAWTPKAVSFFISFITIIAFVALAGAQIAAIRAGSMATIALIARTTSREYDGIRALLLVAAVMTLYNPDQVLFSTSFHMSFLATLGLLIFSPMIERLLNRMPEKFEIRNIIASTLATQIFLLPYLAYAIGEVSIIGIPANIFILPIIPIAMLFGSAVTAIAVVSPVIASGIAPIAYLPLRAITFLAEFFSQIPYATLSLPKIPVALVVMLTALLVYIGYEYMKHGKNN